ncbi:bifunctional adenosylcobinamide kinase/adenosylcobinamide-phosphate guanylyltransferase [Planomonospora corallina]|uniref:Adenosylcobinamide kinase n=1 Tax=Planomonospora corallina TaxID=1806052 RepID=A0ABV8I6C5_9ACTN
MRVLFEGTAGPYGLPVPGCPCAPCARVAVPRKPALVLVDGRPVLPGETVVTAGGRRLLYAAPDAASGDGPCDGPCDAGPFDVVLIDVLDRPERLGGLRRRGLVTGRTHVVAVGIDHRAPSEAELGRRLALWGVRAVPDGTVLDTDEDTPARPCLPRRSLLLGGSRSGKSAEAELRLLAEPEVVYVATGPSGDGDPEWRERVRAHRERRPAHWSTVESTDVAGLLGSAPAPLLIDGLGTWVAAVLDECGAWEGGPGALARAEERCDELVAAWRRARRPVVAVSDEVGLGVVPATAGGRLFRDVLGRLNQRLAAETEDVALVVAGRLLPLPL